MFFIGIENQSKCAPFQPCFTQESCKGLGVEGEYYSYLHLDWIYFFLIVSIGLALIVFAEGIPRLPEKMRNRIINRAGNLRSKIVNMRTTHCTEDAELGLFEEKAHLPEKDAFVNTSRNEINFIRNNMDPCLDIPNPYGPEYDPKHTVGSFYPITSFWESSLCQVKGLCIIKSSVIIGTLGIALMSSALSSLMWIIIHFERECSIADFELEKIWFKEISDGWERIINGYKFYPIFLISGYIAYMVARWRDFFVNCHTIQARIHDVALLTGSSPTFPVSHPVRQKLYKIYRYLNLVHALCYKSVSPTVGPLQIETDFVDRLGLLLPEEVEVLLPMDNKIRDTVVAWLSSDVLDLLHTEGVRSDYVLELAASIRELRSICARHHDLFVRDNPNMYLDVLSAVVNLWLFLVILGYPFSLAVYTPHGYRGLLPPSAQPITAIGVFVLVCSMRVALCFVTRLRNPFSWTADRIKVDSLMAGSDRTVFAFLRARFDSRTATKKMSTQPEDSGMLSWSKSYSEPFNEHVSIKSETSCHTEATVELGASFHSEEAVANHSPRSLPPGRGSMRRRVSNVY